MDYSNYFTPEELENANKRELRRVRNAKLLYRGLLYGCSAFAWGLSYWRIGWLIPIVVLCIVIELFAQRVVYADDDAMVKAIKGGNYFFREDSVVDVSHKDISKSIDSHSQYEWYVAFNITEYRMNATHKERPEVGTAVLVQIWNHHGREMPINAFPRKIQ